MSAYTIPIVKARFFDANGKPLVGGKLYSYLAGTVTPRDTYNVSSAAPGTENTNPVILDANGEADIFITSGYYKFVLTDANDVPQWTEDNISLPQTAVGGFPAGGTANQLLSKLDGTDYTTQWLDPVGIFGTRAAPSLITAAGGISFSGKIKDNIAFIAGNAAPITVTKNPQISVGTYIGQTLELIGRDDTNTVTISDGNGLDLNAEMILASSSVIGLRWDGTNWVERYRTSS